MAIQPGEYNFTLQRRADHSITLQFKDGAGTPIDLTGWTVAAQAWNEGRTYKYADFAVTYIDRSTGTVAIALTDEQTTALPITAPFTSPEVYYDVLLTNPSGFREYYLEGYITVSEGYTA